MSEPYCKLTYCRPVGLSLQILFVVIDKLYKFTEHVDKLSILLFQGGL